MKISTRLVPLFCALALGSYALGAVTASRVTAAVTDLGPVPILPSSGGDASVPAASTVTFPAGLEAAAPTF